MSKRHALARVAQRRHRVDGPFGWLVSDPDAPVEIEDELLVAGGQGVRDTTLLDAWLR